MRLDWIEDILAVLDCGSLARAAKKRSLTQPAFTRRVRLIEEYIGAELFDRRRKPVTLMAGVETLAPELRDLSLRLHNMRYRLKTAASPTGGALSFSCQHAITTTVAPRIVRALTDGNDASIRVRSANRDECMMLLLSGGVDFVVMYTLPDAQTTLFALAFESLVLGRDTLVPVCAPGLLDIAASNHIPAISYPSDAFLGQVFEREIAPRLQTGTNIATKAETALTLAAYEFALGGIGVAWLPRSLVSDSLTQGHLISLEDRLPVQELEIRAFRIVEARNTRSDAIWHDILTNIVLPPDLKRLPDTAAGQVQPVKRAEQ